MSPAGCDMSCPAGTARGRYLGPGAVEGMAGPGGCRATSTRGPCDNCPPRPPSQRPSRIPGYRPLPCVCPQTQAAPGAQCHMASVILSWLPPYRHTNPAMRALILHGPLSPQHILMDRVNSGS